MIRRIGIKYCGNCNPVIDNTSLIAKLKETLIDWQFVRWDEPDKDVIMILSGCPRDCATRPSVKVPTIVVAGFTVNGWEVQPEQVVDILVERIKEIGFAK